MHILFGVRIDDVSMQQLKEQLISWLMESNVHCIFTPNPEFILSARKDSRFVEILNQSDLSLADGVGLRFAVAALTQDRLLHRQTGVDTLMLLSELCAKQKKRLLLLGGMSGVARKAAGVLKRQWTELEVVSLEPGFIPGGFGSLSIPESLTHKIRAARPDVMAVALGQGRQERFILEMKDRLPTLKIAIGVGGALDMISGRLCRAPAWMRRNGLEWMWRVLIEPKRIHRIFRAIIIFPSVVIWDTLKHRGFLRALKQVLRGLRTLFLIV